MKKIILTTCITILLLSCKAQIKKETIFPKGDSAPVEYFTGTVWLYHHP